MDETPEPWQSPHQPSWNTAKLVIRIVSVIVSLPLFAVSISSLSVSREYRWFGIWGTPFSAMALCYDMADFVVMCVQKRKSGVRPSVAIGLELFISVVGVAFSVMIILGAVGSLQWRYYRDDEGVTRLDMPLYGDPTTNGFLWFGLSITASILAVFLTLIHFILFVRACAEVDRQRKVVLKYLSKLRSSGSNQPQENQPQEMTTTSGAPPSSEPTVTLDDHEDASELETTAPRIRHENQLDGYVEQKTLSMTIPLGAR
ncbi:hypothetical protein GGR54DRAFT_555129 [Hypoxylon sp. NC1633]|nr:hypothetical protein GGR54DRAFT_555129 [Hypoxylon sp. NC1633]